MNFVLLIGSHPRHAFFAKQFLVNHPNTKIIIMTRESMIPSNIPQINLRDRRNYERHFFERVEREEHYFGSQSDLKCDFFSGDIFDFETQVIKYLSGSKIDVVLVFGTGLLSKPLLDFLPAATFNLHLGLSPRYKGSATLFWPFYMFEPNHSGYTLHKITSKIDAGPVLSQGLPELKLGDGIHDVSCKTVIKAASDIRMLASNWQRHGRILAKPQNKSGKLWLASDFRPHHLRNVYEVFENNVVDAYLKNEISPPKVVIETQESLNLRETIEILI